jgi:tetratricopeptide (TPR) repeat protein
MAFEKAEGSGISERDVYDVINSLNNVVQFDTAVDTLTFSNFLDTLADITVSAGEHGDRFYAQEFVSLLDSAVPRLAAAGLPTWPLLVAKASYYSRENNGRESRREALQAAYDDCCSNREKLDVGLMLAQHNIDICKYLEAHRILSQCRALCTADPSCAIRLPQLNICYGNVHYVQGYLRTGLKYFQAAPSVTRSVVRAHHYSGKILSALGRHQEALGHLVLMQQYACVSETEELRRGGFLHLRLGEVLTAAGSLDEAHFHLAESRRVFARLRESSTAQAILDSAFASLSRRLGRFAEAHALLARAVTTARRNGYQRGVVLFQTKSALYYFGDRNWRASLRSGWAALAAWMVLSGQGNSLRAALGSAEYVTSYLRLRFRRGRSRRVMTVPVRCPCDDCRAQTRHRTRTS